MMTRTADELAGMVDSLVTGAAKALADYDSYDQERIDRIVKKSSVAALDRHAALARLAVEETGRGVFEDKAVKNIFACEHVTHSLAKVRTVGVISEDEITGVVEIADPVGVVAGITPVTNPTSTTIFKALLALKTRNPIIFAFHPAAQRCSTEAARVVRDAAVAAGAPEHCIQWIEQPSVEDTTALMHHPGVATILATGGNGMICASEQAVILDDEIYDAALAESRGCRRRPERRPPAFRARQPPGTGHGWPRAG